MNLSAILWDVSPEIFQLGPLTLRWYGLLFGTGLMVLGPWIMYRIWKREKLDEVWLEKLFWYAMIGTIVGARLGHCLFYEPAYYLANPIRILKIWEGGLASHGGTIGLIIMMWIYSRRVTHKPILWIMDRFAVPVGLAAAMIRLGNLMNSEIFGRPTDASWGFQFIRSGEYQVLAQQHPELLTTMGVHPTAIYEALAYFIIFGICMWLYWRRDAARRYSGLIVGTLFTGVFIARLFIEQIKLVQVDWELNLIDKTGLNQGQLLSIPFIIAGVAMIIYAFKTKNKQQ